MTEEIALEIIKAYRERLQASPSNLLDEDIEAFGIAINAMQGVPTSNQDKLMAITDETYTPMHSFLLGAPVNGELATVVNRVILEEGNHAELLRYVLEVIEHVLATVSDMEQANSAIRTIMLNFHNALMVMEKLPEKQVKLTVEGEQENGHSQESGEDIQADI